MALRNQASKEKEAKRKIWNNYSYMFWACGIGSAKVQKGTEATFAKASWL
tara:strand:+ start:68 stop:217 length:150 start_codon:yes stop_codon:yes gene_type:complete